MKARNFGLSQHGLDKGRKDCFEKVFQLVKHEELSLSVITLMKTTHNTWPMLCEGARTETRKHGY